MHNRQLSDLIILTPPSSARLYVMKRFTVIACIVETLPGMFDFSQTSATTM